MTMIQPDWPAPQNVRALTTTRSLWGEKNTQTPTERERLRTLLDLPASPVWLKQTHGTIALPAEPQYNDQEADASYTSKSRHICLVLTADCLPLLVCDKAGKHVAAIHAGWRGLASGVIENTIQCLHQPPDDLLVWLGPAISQGNYEVGADVYETFIVRDPAATTCFTPGKPGKWMASLYQLAKLRLARLGITAVYGGNYCTHENSDLFFSWRRDGMKEGRMASLIWIE